MTDNPCLRPACLSDLDYAFRQWKHGEKVIVRYWLGALYDAEEVLRRKQWD